MELEIAIGNYLHILQLHSLYKCTEQWKNQLEQPGSAVTVIDDWRGCDSLGVYRSAFLTHV